MLAGQVLGDRRVAGACGANDDAERWFGHRRAACIAGVIRREQLGQGLCSVAMPQTSASALVQRSWSAPAASRSGSLTMRTARYPLDRAQCPELGEHASPVGSERCD